MASDNNTTPGIRYPYATTNDPAALVVDALRSTHDPEEARLAEQDEIEDANLAPGLRPGGASSPAACKSPCTDDEVRQAWVELFNHVSLEARQSLERSPARIIQRGPSRLGLRGGSGGSPSPSGQRSPSPGGSDNNGGYDSDEEFPSEAERLMQEVGNVPREILLVLQDFLPPINELLLGWTHPTIFHCDNFSFYYIDAVYQQKWQLGTAMGEERLPLLHHAIKCNAPLPLIVQVLDTWRDLGLDLDLGWVKNSPRVRQKRDLLIEPIFLAAVVGRDDVIRELIDRGASTDNLDRWIMTMPRMNWAARHLRDANWDAMEGLAIELYQAGLLRSVYRPFSPRLKRMYEGCVVAGWVTLLRWFIDPLADLQPIGGEENQLHDDMVRQSHLNLGFELVEWLGFVTRVRLDNTAMIDYLDELYEKSFAATGRRIPINNWAGLDQTVFQQDGSPAMRMTNAVHIINRFAARSRAMATHLTSYQDVWVTSDDFLPLAQACHNGLVAVYNSAPEPDLNTIHVARARMLHHALGSRVGVPGTVRWLALVARVPLFADGRHAVQCLLEYGLRHNPYLLRENMNVLLELVGINEVFPGGHLDAGVRDARPIDLLIFEDAPLVELVARGGVDLTLANPVTVQYCVGRRALRSDRIDMRGNGMPLVEIMRSENFPYDIKRRILHWCIVRSTNNAVRQMSDI